MEIIVNQLGVNQICVFLTSTIVLMDVAIVITPLTIDMIFLSIIPAIVITYYMMQNSDYMMKIIGQRKYRVVNCLRGMLLIAIAVQYVTDSIRVTFPC